MTPDDIARRLAGTKTTVEIKEEIRKAQHLVEGSFPDSARRYAAWKTILDEYDVKYVVLHREILKESGIDAQASYDYVDYVRGSVNDRLNQCAVDIQGSGGTGAQGSTGGMGGKGTGK